MDSVCRDFGRGRDRRRVVDDVSFEIAPGEVLGVLGPNGAGKTTTIKMAATLLEPTSGEVRVAGVDAVRRPREARRSIGLVLGGDRGFYMRATARDNLLFFADLSGVTTDRMGRVRQVLRQTGLADRGRSRVETFSRGMKQRLHIARALLADPALILLDEPSIGLDPEGAHELRQLVRDLRSEGRSVLLTTHYLDEADQLSDRLLVVDEGSVLVTGSSQDVAAQAGLSSVTTLVADAQRDPMPMITDSSSPVRCFTSQVRGLWTLDIMWGDRGMDQGLLARLREDLDVVTEHTRHATLEESYLALLRSPSGINGTGAL